MDDRAPTIRDVAARAGVSKSLVSLVLQGGKNVSPARREAVEVAIEALGYRPNATARNLSQSRTRTVGVLLNDLRNPWFADLLEIAGAALHEAELSPLLVDANLERRSGRDPAELFLDQRVEGLLVVGTAADSAVVEQLAARVPTVLAGTSEPKPYGVDIVAIDDVLGESLATRHLIELGHRDIGLIVGPGGVGEQRRIGYQNAMRAAGLGDRLREAPTDTTERGGYEAATALLDTGTKPTALVAYNDIGAVGALAAAAERGLRVPGDLSVVGYDDTHLAKMLHLSLTSVDIRNAEVGRIAADLLLARIADPALPFRREVVRPELRVRSTTRAWTDPK